MTPEIGGLDQILEFLKQRKLSKMSPGQPDAVSAPEESLGASKAPEESPEAGQVPGGVLEELKSSGEAQTTEGGDDEELKKLMEMYSSLG